MKILLQIFLCLIFWQVQFYGFSQKLESEFNQIKNFELQGDYENALLLLTDLLNEYPHISEIRYHIAICEMERHNYFAAKDIFEEMFAADLQKKYPLITFYLAKLQLMFADEIESQRSFRYFLNNCSDSSYNKEKELSKIYVKKCESLDNISVSKIDLPEEFLSIYGANFYDDNLFYYQTRIADKTLKTIGLNEQFLIQKLLNLYDDSTNVDIADVCINNSKSRIYYSRCEYANRPKCQIFFVDKNDENIVPHRFLNEINISSQICFVNDSVAYFVSQNSSSDYDIFSAKIDEKGYGFSIKYLPINTIGDEVSPYYSKKEKKLYFSSNGRPTFGGLDIYSCEILETGFGIIEHLPQNINSTFDDLYFVKNQANNKCNFVSNRLAQNIDGDSLFLNKLFAVEMPNLQNKIFNLYFAKSFPKNDNSLYVNQLDSLRYFTNDSIFIKKANENYWQLLDFLSKKNDCFVKILISGSYSAEGNLQENEQLAKFRANCAEQFIRLYLSKNVSAKIEKTIVRPNDNLSIEEQRCVQIKFEF